MTRKPRPFTERQQKYISAIVAASLAPLEEVEATFRARTQEAGAQIASWGRILSKQRRDAHEEYFQSRTHCHEPPA